MSREIYMGSGSSGMPIAIEGTKATLAFHLEDPTLFEQLTDRLAGQATLRRSFGLTFLCDLELVEPYQHTDPEGHELCRRIRELELPGVTGYYQGHTLPGMP